MTSFTEVCSNIPSLTILLTNLLQRSKYTEEAEQSEVAFFYNYFRYLTFMTSSGKSVVQFFISMDIKWYLRFFFLSIFSCSRRKKKKKKNFGQSTQTPEFLSLSLCQKNLVIEFPYLSSPRQFNTISHPCVVIETLYRETLFPEKKVAVNIITPPYS